MIKDLLNAVRENKKFVFKIGLICLMFGIMIDLSEGLFQALVESRFFKIHVWIYILFEAVGGILVSLPAVIMFHDYLKNRKHKTNNTSSIKEDSKNIKEE